MSLLTLTLQFHAQEVWCEGTSWETHYDDGKVETFTLSGTAVINGTTYMNLVSNASGLVGYIRAEQGDRLVYARGIVDGQPTSEVLLYDFSQSFEYDGVFRYGALENGVPTVMEITMDRETAKMVWYDDVLGEGISLPAWNNIVYKVGWLGNPMELFYNSSQKSSARKSPGRSKPNPTNVSHIVFRPGGGKAKIIRTVRYEGNGPSEEMKDFAFRFYDAMLKRSKEPNMVMSPLSAQIAVSMLMNGADSETLQQIRSAMGVSDYTDDEVNSYNMQLVESMLALQEEEYVNLETVNGLWVRQGARFMESFFQDIRNYYDAEPEAVDFGSQETVDHINGWAKEKSHGLIEEILDMPNDEIRFMLANSLYFKGKWPHYFDPDYTRKADFHNSDGSITQVDMMNSGKLGARAVIADNYSAVELAYGNEKDGGKNSNFGMLIFLPNNPGDELKITKELFDQTVAKLEEQFVYVRMPRFKVDLDNNLGQVFQDMGMTDMFNLRAADFSRLTGNLSTKVSDARQFISYSVDENGTEAAGITVIMGVDSDISPHPTPIPFILDCPFQFVLYDKVHNVPLFIGQVNNMENAKNEKPLDDGSRDGFFCKLDKKTMEATIINGGYGRLYKGDIIIPDSIHSDDEAYAVTKIGDKAFGGSNITSVTFPKTLREIEGNAFMISHIKSISIPESVHIHGELNFWGCSNLQEVRLPDTLTRIPYQCFWSCSNLKKITLPSAIREIGMAAFEDCRSLNSIVLPPSLERIEVRAFLDCDALNFVYIQGERMPEIVEYSFNRKYLITLYVPESMIPEYKASSLWSGFKAILPLPDEYWGIDQPLSSSPEGESMGTIYDLQGRRLNKAPKKGLYIQDGKKAIK